MKKKLWVGLVNSEIKFFNDNPNGNVQGLQGSRPFTVTGACELHDDTGNNIIDSVEANTNSDGASGSVVNQQNQQTQA